MITKRDNQALQFLRPAPESLARLIEEVNLIPPSRVLIDIHELAKNWDAEVWAAYDNEDYANSIKKSLEVCLIGLPEDFRKYIYKYGENTNQQIINAHIRYKDFRELWLKLRTLARLSTQIYSKTNLSPNKEVSPNEKEMRHLRWSFEFLRLRTEEIKLEGKVSINVDDDGRVYLGKDRLTRAIEGIEIARLKECVICQRIFWAGRITQRCCSKQCANTLRVRRHREKYTQDPVEYKQRRYEREKQRKRNISKPKQGKAK